MKEDAKAGQPEASGGILAGSAKTGSAATQFKPGNKANPGGLSEAEREARDAVRKALSGDLREVGLAAYKRLLESDNPVIVKDFMDRVAGKVKEQVELSQDPSAPINAYAQVTVDELKAVARAQLEKERAK